jgi:hypothetical protein
MCLSPTIFAVLLPEVCLLVSCFLRHKICRHVPHSVKIEKIWSLSTMSDLHICASRLQVAKRCLRAKKVGGKSCGEKLSTHFVLNTPSTQVLRLRRQLIFILHRLTREPPHFSSFIYLFNNYFIILVVPLHTLFETFPYRLQCVRFTALILHIGCYNCLFDM